MIINPNNLRIFFLAILLLSAAIAQSAEPTKNKAAAPPISSDISYTYQLFPTTNVWTQLLLDTATGRLWQVQFSVNDKIPTGKFVINDSSLLPKGEAPKNGRFTLSPTPNMYTFLLLDRQNSRIWQIQWSTEPANRGIVHSISEAETIGDK